MLSTMMMNRSSVWQIVLVVFVCLVVVCNGTRYTADWKSLDSRPLPSWFDEAKVGIFLHWGVFSVPSFGSEWFWNHWHNKDAKTVEFMKRTERPDFTYADFAKEFTCEFFNPTEWAEIFRSSGAKYVVLTSKHHEGYTLWPSNHSFNWNSKDVGPNRDLVGELGQAVRKAGLKYGLYHSLFEWYNPLYLRDKKNKFATKDYVHNKLRPELKELVESYHPEILWSDGDWEASEGYWESTDFLAWLFNDSPVKNSIVVNDRWGSSTHCKHGSFYTCYDRYNPKKLVNHKWENAMTIDKSSWGFRREATLHDYLTIEQLIVTLVETVSCGGNLNINIGPTKSGTLVPIFQERLKQLGQWLSVNGEAIYGSKPWTSQNDSTTGSIWYTQKSNTVYGMATLYPESHMLEFGSVPFDRIHSVSLLGVKGSVSYESFNKHTRVKFPQLTPNDKARYTYTFKFVMKN